MHIIFVKYVTLYGSFFDFYLEIIDHKVMVVWDNIFIFVFYVKYNINLRMKYKTIFNGEYPQ